MMNNSVDVPVPSPFQDNTVLRVKIGTGVDRYVTESMEETGSRKSIAKARQKPTVTLISVSSPVLDRK